MISPDTTQLDLHRLKALLLETACPFRPPYPFHWTHPTATVSGEAFALRPGLGFARLHLRAKDKTRVPISLPKDLFYLCFNHSGELNFILPDLGHQCLFSYEWGILAGTQIRVLHAKNTEVSLLLFIIEKTLLRSFVELSELSWQSPLHCFSCPKAAEPTFLKGEASKRLRLLTEVILHGGGNRKIIDRLVLESRCLEWVSELFQQPEITEGRDCLSLCNHADIEAIRTVAAYLDSNLGAKHSLSDLSRRAHLNEFKLKRGFRELYNTTVFAYLRDKRMLWAECILRRGKCSVIEVANAVGYTNPSHFAQAFKQRFGILPSAYRKLNKQTGLPPKKYTARKE